MKMHLKSYPREWRRDASCRITERLLASDEYSNAETVVLYSSFGTEVDTGQLVTASSGRTILLPVCVDGNIRLREFNPGVKMERNVLGMDEPVAGDYFTDYASIDLIVVPGLAFDLGMNRLGRGKGYYDRFLPEVPDAVKVGICFDVQLLETLPVSGHDVRMDAIMTEKRALRNMAALSSV